MSLELDERHHAMLAAMGIELPFLQPVPSASSKQAAATLQPQPPSTEQAFVDTLSPAVRRMSLAALSQGQTPESVEGETISAAPAEIALETAATASNSAEFDTKSAVQAAKPAWAAPKKGVSKQVPEAVPIVWTADFSGEDGTGRSLSLAPAIGCCLLLIDQASGEGGRLFKPEAQTLLANILRAAQLAPEQVVVSAIAPAHPHATPSAADLQTIAAHWQTQIASVQPSVILLMGRLALRSLLASDAPLGKLREQTQSFAGVPTLASYPPEYLLRNPADKAKAWRDWVSASRLVRERAAS